MDRIPLGTMIYIDILNKKEWMYKVYRPTAPTQGAIPKEGRYKKKYKELFAGWPNQLDIVFWCKLGWILLTYWLDLTLGQSQSNWQHQFNLTIEIRKEIFFENFYFGFNFFYSIIALIICHFNWKQCESIKTDYLLKIALLFDKNYWLLFS